jgi:hypothetical protein
MYVISESEKYIFAENTAGEEDKICLLNASLFTRG